MVGRDSILHASRLGCYNASLLFITIAENAHQLRIAPSVAENWTTFMTTESKNMEPYRPIRHNCRAEFRSQYVSSSEVGWPTIRLSLSRQNKGVGRAKKWIHLVNSDLCGLLRSQVHWISSVLSLREPARPNWWIGGGDSKYSSGCFWIW